jgi:cyclohexanone monooxygenase
MLMVRTEQSVLEATPEERQAAFEERWTLGGVGFLGAFNDLVVSREANEIAAAFVHGKIREIVSDPEVAELLCPNDHPIGTKRICIGSDYFETYNRDNVELVDVRRSPITRITPRGIATADREFEVDVIVFAIGFDAMTGALLDIDVRGAGGRSLREKWEHGPRTYLGLAIEGFPNLFAITGPGSPGVLSNMALSIEQHVDWIADCLAYLRANGLDRIEATAEAEEAWVRHVNELADETLYTVSNSWYIGSNIAGKPRVFMPYVGGCGRYRGDCDAVAAAGYDGFALANAAVAAD